MAQEAISATSKYWDDKRIELTENTKKNIMKKAYALDAEMLLSQYNLEGDDAAKALEQQGVTEEQLIANPNTYSYTGINAITALETNASKQSRVNAIIGLTKLGFTNIYENNTKNFITPPEEEEIEEMPKPPPEEPETRQQYLRRSRPPPPEPQQFYEQAEVSEPQPVQDTGPTPYAQLKGAARFIPNTVRQVLPQRGPNNMTPARMSPQPQNVVQARPNFVRAQPRGNQRVQPAVQRNVPQQPRSLLNNDMARKLGGRVAPVSQGGSIRPRAKFGLGVRR